MDVAPAAGSGAIDKNTPGKSTSKTVTDTIIGEHEVRSLRVGRCAPRSS